MNDSMHTFPLVLCWLPHLSVLIVGYLFFTCECALAASVGEGEREGACITETDSGVIALFEAVVPRQHWRGSAKDSRTHHCQSICSRRRKGRRRRRQGERWASRWMTGVGG